MKKLLLILLILFPLLSFGQNNTRFDYIASTTTGHGDLVPMLAIPGAAIAYYTDCTSLPCATRATTYISASGTTTCPSNAQVVWQLSDTCHATADSQGNFGGWFQSGLYQYTITTQGQTFGPYNFSIGSGSGGGASVFAGMIDCHTFQGAGDYTPLIPCLNSGTNVVGWQGPDYTCTGNCDPFAGGPNYPLGSEVLTTKFGTWQMYIKSPPTGYASRFTYDMQLPNQNVGETGNCWVQPLVSTNGFNPLYWSGTHCHSENLIVNALGYKAGSESIMAANGAGDSYLKNDSFYSKGGATRASDESNFSYRWHGGVEPNMFTANISSIDGNTLIFHNTRTSLTCAEGLQDSCASPGVPALRMSTARTCTASSSNGGFTALGGIIFTCAESQVVPAGMGTTSTVISGAGGSIALPITLAYGNFTGATSVCVTPKSGSTQFNALVTGTTSPSGGSQTVTINAPAQYESGTIARVQAGNCRWVESETDTSADFGIYNIYAAIVYDSTHVEALAYSFTNAAPPLWNFGISPSGTGTSQTTIGYAFSAITNATSNGSGNGTFFSGQQLINFVGHTVSYTGTSDSSCNASGISLTNYQNGNPFSATATGLPANCSSAGGTIVVSGGNVLKVIEGALTTNVYSASGLGANDPNVVSIGVLPNTQGYTVGDQVITPNHPYWTSGFQEFNLQSFGTQVSCWICNSEITGNHFGDLFQFNDNIDPRNYTGFGGFQVPGDAFSYTGVRKRGFVLGQPALQGFLVENCGTTVGCDHIPAHNWGFAGGAIAPWIANWNPATSTMTTSAQQLVFQGLANTSVNNAIELDGNVFINKTLLVGTQILSNTLLGAVSPGYLVGGLNSTTQTASNFVAIRTNNNNGIFGTSQSWDLSNTRNDLYDGPTGRIQLINTNINAGTDWVFYNSVNGLTNTLAEVFRLPADGQGFSMPSHSPVQAACSANETTFDDAFVYHCKADGSGWVRAALTTY